MSVYALSARGLHGGGTVRVLTLNLWGRQGDWPARRAVLVAGLRALRPDLVALQEPIVGDVYDQAADLLGPGYRLFHRSGGLLGDSDHNGAAIASRWPLVAAREVDLHLTPRTADFPCTTLVAEIAAPDPVGPLLFVNHLPSWQPAFEYEREMQAVAAARSVEEVVGGRDLHVVLAGDFTADPEAANVRFWTGRQSLDGVSVCYLDAWASAHPGEAGHTGAPQNPLRDVLGIPTRPGRRLDYVLVRNEGHGPTLAVAACELAFDEPVDGVWASDHFGVVADLTVPPRNPGLSDPGGRLGAASPRPTDLAPHA